MDGLSIPNHAFFSKLLTGEVDYLHAGHNLRGLFRWEEVAFEANFANCRSVVIGAAGGGREVIALCRRGLKIDAFECNPDLVDACKAFLTAQGIEAGVFGARPNELPEALGVYDGAILGWGAYMHIAGREQRIEFVRQFRRHLEPGGPLLLSFLTFRDSRAHRLGYRAAALIRALRRAEPIERGDCLGTRFDHHFTEEEVRRELLAADFSVVSYAEHPYGYAVAKAI